MNKGDKEIRVSGEGKWDQSKRAEVLLDHILHTEVSSASEEKDKPKADTISVEEALRQRPILDKDTGRNKSRVLFVSTEEDILDINSSARNHYLKMSELFDEIHVMVLIPRKGNNSYDRPVDNIWIYKIFCNNVDELPTVALDSAIDALTFRGQVRPDVIVGIDPFDAGLAAYKIAAAFLRPIQLHINTNLFSYTFRSSAEGKRKYDTAIDLLRKVASVRTKTNSLKETISKRFKKIVDISLIPHFYNFKGLSDVSPTFNLHTKYPSFSFIIVAFGPLTADSHLHDLFTAITRTFHSNPRIGLVIVGDGPSSELFTEKVKLLGIEKNVIFQKIENDIVSYLKTADLLVEVSTKEDSEIRVLQAAAAGLPMVAFSTDLREDLFEDGDSAFLCPQGDTDCVFQKVTKYINNPVYKKKFSEQSSAMAKDRLEEDEVAYYLSLRHTIEKVLM